jgi:hypothetical protein
LVRYYLFRHEKTVRMETDTNGPLSDL